MSLTLPYATAVNCKFVNLPDTLATNDNTLKLYNIDGGGGGTTDAYTKEESDARFLRLATATDQSVTQLPLFAKGIKLHDFLKLSLVQGTLTQMVDMRPYTVDETQTSAFLLHSRPNTNQYIYKKPLYFNYTGGSATDAPITALNFGAGGGIELAPAATIVADTPYIKFSTTTVSGNRGKIIDNGTGACYIGDEVRTAKMLISANVILRAEFNSGSIRDVWIPAVSTNGAQLLSTHSTYAQTVNNALTVANDFTAQALKFSATPTAAFNSSTNGITAAQETTTGTIPSSSAVCNWTKNYAIPKTDIVTTVTGVSDSKVASEKAVKTYVDAAGIPKTDIVTTVTGVSDSKVASEKAVKTYVDSKIPASNNSFTIRNVRSLSRINNGMIGVEV